MVGVSKDILSALLSAGTKSAIESGLEKLHSAREISVFDLVWVMAVESFNDGLSPLLVDRLHKVRGMFTNAEIRDQEALCRVLECDGINPEITDDLIEHLEPYLLSALEEMSKSSEEAHRAQTGCHTPASKRVANRPGRRSSQGGRGRRTNIVGGTETAALLLTRTGNALYYGTNVSVRTRILLSALSHPVYMFDLQAMP